MPTPAVAPPHRPALLTGAAVILFVFGAIGLIAAVWLLTGGGGAGVVRDQARSTVGLVPLAIGVLYVTTGVLILRLRPAGQILGFVSAAIMIVNGLLRFGRTPGAGLLGLGMAGLLIYALAAHSPRFRRTEPG